MLAGYKITRAAKAHSEEHDGSGKELALFYVDVAGYAGTQTFGVYALNGDDAGTLFGDRTLGVRDDESR